MNKERVVHEGHEGTRRRRDGWISLLRVPFVSFVDDLLHPCSSVFICGSSSFFATSRLRGGQSFPHPPATRGIACGTFGSRCPVSHSTSVRTPQPVAPLAYSGSSFSVSATPAMSR